MYDAVWCRIHHIVSCVWYQVLSKRRCVCVRLRRCYSKLSAIIHWFSSLIHWLFHLSGPVITSVFFTPHQRNSQNKSLCYSVVFMTCGRTEKWPFIVKRASYSVLPVWTSPSVVHQTSSKAFFMSINLYRRHSFVFNLKGLCLPTLHMLTYLCA